MSNASSDRSGRYQVRKIALGSDVVVAAFESIGEAFDECISRWSTRKAGSPVFAVCDSDSGQRWSYADLTEVRR